MTTEVQEYEAVQEDGILPELVHSVKLPVFEGPLDLLLFLIRKHEIDIYDIPIELITRQYLDVLSQMDELNLNVTGEFFVMAASLMLIKSRMLLPKKERVKEEVDLDKPEEEAGMDPRWELVEQLLEYQKLKEQSTQINDLIDRYANSVPREGNLLDEGVSLDRPLKPADRFEVWNAYNRVLERLIERLATTEIYDESVTMADQMKVLMGKLEADKQFYFSSVFEGQKEVSVNVIITTFLAALELGKQLKVSLHQGELYDDILCSSVV